VAGTAGATHVLDGQSWPMAQPKTISGAECSVWRFGVRLILPWPANNGRAEAPLTQFERVSGIATGKDWPTAVHLARY